MRSSTALFVALVFAVLAVPKAHADIAAFNNAIKAGDFKSASREAGTTWPTLDKNREDIEVIAREFGFASYMAGDFAQARALAEFAATHPTPEGVPPDFHAISQVLFRLAEHRVKPSSTTRNQLFVALRDRLAFNGMDNITYLGADALVAYDFEVGDWKPALEGAQLAVKIAASGGPSYTLNHRRFELYADIAEFMVSRKPAVYDKFGALLKNTDKDINAAPDDKAAERLVPLYWEVSAWLESIDSYFNSAMLRHGLDGKGEILTEDEKNTPITPREANLLSMRDGDDPCTRKLTVRPMIEYPGSAMFQGTVGTVVLKVDIDDTGHASNPKILAAVPDKTFAKAVLGGVPNIRFAPGEKWNSATCKMGDPGHRVTFKFQILP